MHVGIFLDRDGTINEEVDFLTTPDHLHVLPGSADAIRDANALGLKVFIITNQSGIARGLLTEAQLDEIHTALRARLAQEHAHIDGIFYCPHHPEAGEAPYRTTCECRKPGTGMLREAAAQFDIDLRKSFVIGDREIDIQTGETAGATAILVLTGYGRNELQRMQQNGRPLPRVAANLREAMDIVKQLIHQNEHTVS